MTPFTEWILLLIYIELTNSTYFNDEVVVLWFDHLVIWYLHFFYFYF